MVENRPSIGLHVHRAVTDAQLRHLLLGIEEEGVPVELTRHDELNPLVLAQGAATESRLGIGIGVSLDYAVTTTEKLPEQRPYVAQWFNRDQLLDRIIGSNAARIVKRIPLRGFSQERNQPWKH
ncbi:glycerol dehydratase reactivase beta/small subunit family protein [Tessaracoccus massiliensis]|uniref:glycerol dehydratase reactivase beta/small subunit family protein n=1 Tax=Tessaracoccus massiliensis TaxID=1522311 RepID=UPI0006943C99|nr:glycerol dehydratase reactivase beta/small subunit family protein [Tessaracoccus massiliensis]